MPSTFKQVLNNLKQKHSGSHLLLSCLSALQDKESFGKGKTIFTLFAPSSLHKKQVIEKGLFLLEKEFSTLLSEKPFEIRIEVLDSPSLPHKRTLFTQDAEKKEKPLKKDPFNPSYTFDNFVLGHSKENHLAFYTAKKLALKPIKNIHSPFFIFGSTGLGKTHLLHSMGHILSKKNLKVVYISAERFLYEFVAALRTHSMDSFRQKYRKNLEVLLIDDIQSLEKGQACQEEFFHTFNSIKERGGLVACTCDRPVKAMKKLQARIQTRLSGGLEALIENPCFETRLAVLQKKAQKKKFFLPKDVSSYIAQKTSHSIREIEGVLNKVEMLCSIYKQSPSLNLIQKIFSKNLTEGVPSKIQDIIKQTALFYQITPALICSKKRSKLIVQARNQAIKKVHQEFKHLSFSEIGRIFGGRSHSTVLHALKKL